MLAPGTSVGRYVIEGVLGEGGMGTVYRASDPVLGRQVALKVVRTKDEGGQKKSEGTSRLLREARAAAALTHPSAVAIYDVGEVGGDPFIAMELVPGKSLSTALLDESYDLATRVRWLIDVARVLDAAHRQGIVHRDIKPDNVVLRDDGAVKVLDFGIARQRIETPFDGVSGSAATLTAQGTTVGTPLYMAPEQMLGEDLDGRADQFSWGVLAFEVLSRDLPWGSPQDGVGIMYAILKKEAPRLAEVRPEVPLEVSAVVARALEKEASDRFPTMAEVVLELEPFAAPSVSDGPLSRGIRSTARPSSREPTPDRRGRWLVPLAFVAIASASALVVTRVAKRPTPGALPSASASTSARPTDITSLPLPETKSAEALAAYKVGVQAIRDGAMGAAVEALGRATTLDPALAAAHLRLALYGSNGGVPTRTTNAFQRAVQLRAGLSPRDQEIVSAMEPYMSRERVDLEETDRRLSALALRWPEDAEIAYLLGAVRFDRDARSMLGEVERAARLDPSFVPPVAIRAHALAYLGDLDGSRRAFEHCATIAPTSSLCAYYHASLLQQEGECAKIETLMRQVLVSEPDSASSLGVLASASASLGRPREAIKALLDQKAAKTREVVRRQANLRDLIRMDILYGHFDLAEGFAKELAQALSSEKNQASHAAATLLLANLYLETGRPKDAGKLAQDFMKTRVAWAPPTNVEDYSIRDDATIPMLTVLARAGVVDRAAFVKDRDLWLTEWRRLASPFYYGYLWIHGYAAPAETTEDGAEAVRALSTWGGVPAYRSQTTVDGQIGLALRLGGEKAEGLGYLRRGAKTCRALFEPFAHVHAVSALAAALEEEGDKDGACAAHKQVLDRWGAAKRSVTAEKSRARVRALGCKW